MFFCFFLNVRLEIEDPCEVLCGIRTEIESHTGRTLAGVHVRMVPSRRCVSFLRNVGDGLSVLKCLMSQPVRLTGAHADAGEAHRSFALDHLEMEDRVMTRDD